MIQLIAQVLVIIALTSSVESEGENESKLSSVLLPSSDKSVRLTRSYYERYGNDRPYDRLDDRRCGRCDDDDDRDDDRRSNKPTYGSRYDRNKSDDDDDDKHYSTDRRSSKNETDDQSDDKGHDDKDRDRHRDRPRNRHRNRYDDRDRYGPDYYDRFLRDRNRYDRYDEPYPRRPLYDRNPYPYDNGYGRYDGNSYRRPYYEDRYDRGSYDDGYGGYGPGVGAGPHDSFRPWDETYRGQSGWDAGGRGYYFASGRPDATAWTQRDYAKPQSSGWQNVGYQSNPSGYSNGYSGGYSGYRDPYRGTGGYASGYGNGYGGHQDAGYGQASGWRNVGENRRPYRDESGYSISYGYKEPVYVTGGYGNQNMAYESGSVVRRPIESSKYGVQEFYGQSNGDARPYRDESGVTKLDNQYNQATDSRYGKPSSYQPGATFSQSTTPETSYLHQREDQLVKVEDATQRDAQ